MGPSKDEAYKDGELAFEEVMKLLVEKYYISDPRRVILNADGTPSNFKGFFHNDCMFAANQLKIALQEMLWNDACAAF